MDLVRYLLEISGLGQDRLQVRWVSATEGQQFAEYVTELTELLRELGPLDRDQHGTSPGGGEPGHHEPRSQMADGHAASTHRGGKCLS